MKTAEEILRQPKYSDKINSQFGIGYNGIKEAMEEYAAQFKPVWISVTDAIPDDEQSVTAKNDDNGHIGKQVKYKNGKFYHEFTSSTSLEIVDVEFKNVTHWQPLP